MIRMVLTMRLLHARRMQVFGILTESVSFEAHMQNIASDDWRKTLTLQSGNMFSLEVISEVASAELGF